MQGRRTGITFIRHALCFINAFMWLVGCAVLCVGVWLRVSYAGYTTLMHHYSAIAADSLCLAAGIITFVLAFCGCCGSWFQNRCMLVTYFTLVVLVFALEVSAGALLFAFRAEVGNSIATELRSGLQAAGAMKENDPVVLSWHHLQQTFMCCGVNGPIDWQDATAWPGKPWVPRSCCTSQYYHDEGCGTKAWNTLRPSSERWHNTGCYDAVRVWLVRRLHLIGMGALILAFIQLFGLIASMLLYCTLGEKRKSHTYKSYATDTT